MFMSCNLHRKLQKNVDKRNDIRLATHLKVFYNKPVYIGLAVYKL